MKAVLLGLITAISVTVEVSGKHLHLPWPQGFKYPSSYVNKWWDMSKIDDDHYSPNFNFEQTEYMDGPNQRYLSLDHSQPQRTIY